MTDCVDVRAGVHTGEIEVAANDVTGIAVHIGSRVQDAAGPGEGASPPIPRPVPVLFQPPPDGPARPVAARVLRAPVGCGARRSGQVGPGAALVAGHLRRRLRRPERPRARHRRADEHRASPHDGHGRGVLGDGGRRPVRARGGPPTARALPTRAGLRRACRRHPDRRLRGDPRGHRCPLPPGHTRLDGVPPRPGGALDPGRVGCAVRHPLPAPDRSVATARVLPHPPPPPCRHGSPGRLRPALRVRGVRGRRLGGHAATRGFAPGAAPRTAARHHRARRDPAGDEHPERPLRRRHRTVPPRRDPRVGPKGASGPESGRAGPVRRSGGRGQGPGGPDRGSRGRRPHVPRRAS